MNSVPPISLFLILFVQICTARELSLPSLPEAVRLLQLETIKGLEQTILAKEDENRRLEEIIRCVEMEKEAVTLQNTLMEEEMEEEISEKESVIRELESRLQFSERDGTTFELEAIIQRLEMEKAALQEENGQRMVAMESEKTQMREEFVKKQMERDASCQDEKREIQDLKNKELDEISERLDQSEMTVAYMSTIMIHSNQMAEEQQNLLKVQSGAIQEFNEEVKVGKNCSTLLKAAADRISVQEEAINHLRASLVTSRNFSELSTSGMDQLNVAPFMMEMLESYNQQAEMIENMKTALEKQGHVEAQTSELLTQLADLRSTVESATINMETLEQQAHMIETQGRSIALLTLRHLSNSSTYAKQVDLMRLTNSPGGCPRHSTFLSHGCYIFLTNLITWAGAKQTCKDLHGHLVKIETEEENEELYNEAVRLNITEADWIGLSDAAEEGNWFWTSGE